MYSDLGGLNLMASGASGDIRFMTGGASEKVRIDSAGNVGIGATNPGGRGSGAPGPYLNVLSASTTGASEVYVGGAGTSTANPYLGTYGFVTTGTSASEKRLGWMAGELEADSATAVSGRLSFWTNNGGALGERMRITKAGSVGIGTNSPQAALDVAGGVRLGDDTNTCGSGNAGTLRWHSGRLEVCNGTAWNSVVALDGSSAGLAAASCKAILDAGLSRGDAFYWIDADGSGGVAPQQVWCDMTTSGGGWTVPVFQGGDTSINSIATFTTFCTGKGFPLAGRGTEAVEAWLVQKRMLWNSNHSLKTGAWPNGRANLNMPMMKQGTDATTLYTIYNQAVCSRPANIAGDGCNSNTTEQFCGYWYNNGWNDSNLGNYPDPEDWGPSNDDGSTWWSCMYR